METGPWRRPSGVAAVVPFASARELLDATLAQIARAAEIAISLRASAGEISDRGDAASTYFLDPARVRLLAQPPALDAELASMSVENVRRDRALLAGLAGANVPLARAFDAWRCDDDDRRILLALVAASVSPRIARLLALLGGDPAAPAITVDALAALLAVGDTGAIRIAARISARQPLEQLGLAQLTRPDLPLARRPIVIAARVVELALGRIDFDASCGATRVPPVIGTGAIDAGVHAAIRAVVERGATPIVGVVGIEHDGIGASATAAGALGYPLLATALSVMMDGRAAGVLREAALHAAVLAIEVDAPAGLAGAAVIERAAALLPVLLVCTRHAPPRLTLPVVAVPTAVPTTEQLSAVLGHEAPAMLPSHVHAVSRAMAALAARNLSPDALFATVAEQLMPRIVGGADRIAARPVSRPMTRRATAIARQWLELERPRRLWVLLSGPAGVGKLKLVDALAQELKIQAHVLDLSVPLDPGLAEAIAAGATIAALPHLGREDIRRLRSISSWARTTGLLVVLTSERMDALDTSDFDACVRLEPPDADDRAELWAEALERRGIALEPSAVRELSRFSMTERRIEHLLSSQPAPTLATLVAAIRRDMGVQGT